MNAEMLIALQLFVVHCLAVDWGPTSSEERELARPRYPDESYEPDSYSSEQFLKCCKDRGFDDECAKFMCRWHNAWRVEPGWMYVSRGSKRKCIDDPQKLNAYKNCFTNFKDNTECCESSTPETRKSERGKCLALCDGTRDLPARLSINLFQECSTFPNGTPNPDFYRFIWCNAGAYVPERPRTTTNNPLNVTLDCAATRTVDVDGFKVVGCLKSNTSAG